MQNNELKNQINEFKKSITIQSETLAIAEREVSAKEEELNLENLKQKISAKPNLKIHSILYLKKNNHIHISIYNTDGHSGMFSVTEKKHFNLKK